MLWFCRDPEGEDEEDAEDEEENANVKDDEAKTTILDTAEKKGDIKGTANGSAAEAQLIDLMNQMKT